jgi:hypothetical protein
MQIDPLHLSIALGPLAVYLLLIGLINISRRPLLTTGTRDVTALAIAVGGFIIIGPMELFLPERAAAQFGGFVWLMLLAIYALFILLVVLILRPRLVIYNISLNELQPVLQCVATKIDCQAAWFGETLVLPSLGIQFYLDPNRALRNVQLISSGPQQNLAGWRELQIALLASLRKTPCLPNPYGFSLITLGLVMVGVLTYSLVQDTHAVAQSLHEMLRL